MKKKLIFVTRALWVGGIESALVNLLNALDYDKYEVTCLLLSDQRELADRLPPECRLLVSDRKRTVSFREPYRFPGLYALTEDAARPSLLHRCFLWAVPAVKWVENRLYIRYLRTRLRGEAFDTCIIYSDTAGETAVRAVNAAQYLLFYHHGSLRRVYHDEIAYKRAGKIITVSREVLDGLKKFRPRYARKMVAVPNLIDVSRVRRLAAEEPEYKFPRGQFHLVTCGRLSPEKGMDLAASACRELLDRGHRDLHWWIIGGGPEEETLRRQAEETGIGNHFHLLGMQINPFPYMAGADLYVQPSRFENHCMGIGEARALCLPILATHAAGRGQIRSGENGLLCRDDPKAIANAVEYLRSHGDVREGYIRCLKENQPEKENAAALSALETLLDGGEG